MRRTGFGPEARRGMNDGQAGLLGLLGFYLNSATDA